MVVLVDPARPEYLLTEYTLLQRSSGRRSAERDKSCAAPCRKKTAELIAQATAIDSLPPRCALNIIANRPGQSIGSRSSISLRGMPPIDVVAGPIEFVYGTIGDVGDANP